MQQNDKDPDLFQTATRGINIFVFLCMVWCRPLQLLTTRPGTAGRRFFGSFSCGLGLIAFPFITPFIGDGMGVSPKLAGYTGAMLFWVLLLLAGIVHRFCGAWMRGRGYSTHSLFWGKPFLPWWLVLTRKPMNIKFKNDALLMIAWGLGFAWLTNSAIVFGYCMLGSLLSIVPVMYADIQDDARVEAAEDAEWDARELAHRLQERRRDRWN